MNATNTSTLELDPSGTEPMLRTDLHDVADLALVFCHGTITTKEDIDTLRQAVATDPNVNVVLDFSHVEALGPEALVALVSLWHTADRDAKRLAIFNPSLAFYLQLRISSLCRIDAELLRLRPHAEALNAQSETRHGGRRRTHALPTAA